MTSTPSVSIVMPLHNDDEWVSSALTSCIQQTLRNIEIICVDDGSTDETCAVVEAHQQRDSRIRLIKQDGNRSAFQARRLGILAAAAPYVLFVDGDDELAPNAARTALRQARVTSADVVGFGVDVVMPDGSTGGRFQASLQPRHRHLENSEIVPAIFPPGETAQGHLWCNLYARELLLNAYADLPDDLMLFRANDIPITFLALARAKKYVSTPQHLYRYFFRRGRSGHRVEDMDTFKFYLGAVDSIECIEDAVRRISERIEDGAALLTSHRSARLSIIGNVLRYCVDYVASTIQHDCLALLCDRVGDQDAIRASSVFCHDALILLSNRVEVPKSDAGVRSVLITTNDMSIGGLQGVVAAQSRYLAESGLSITIAVHTLDDAVHNLPPSVRLIEISGATRADKLSSWLDICRACEADIIVDHHILYNEYWPYFALIANSIGIPTIGWLHNFALRTVYNFSDRGSFLRTHLRLLKTVVALSTSDVAFWKLQGIESVVWLPNPPSPLLMELDSGYGSKAPPEGSINLVWWGRLQQHTKQVRELIAVADRLRAMDVQFRLTIIGPDTNDLSATQLLEDATRLGVADAVDLPGPLHGKDLLDALLDAHVFVSTSVIEGNPLTISEAQATGMPVVMYELPWVESIKDNDGIVAVPQGAIAELVDSIARIGRDAQLYSELSSASLSAAHDALSFDMTALYMQLFAGDLPSRFTPEPSLADASLLLDWAIYYSERNSRVQTRATRRLRAQLRSELDATRRSFTFRVGRVVAFLPRQLFRLVRPKPPVTELEAARPSSPPTTVVAVATASTPSADPESVMPATGDRPRSAREWSKRILLPSMRQANLIAEQQRVLVEQANSRVLGSQTELSRKLSRIETILETTMTRSDEVMATVGATADKVACLPDAIASSEIRLVAKLEEIQSPVMTAHDRSRVALRTAHEAVWGSVFHDTIEGSHWFTDRALSPGRWAVGYPFLYVMYRVLDEVKPRSILEVGLGQSTKVSAQYVAHSEGVHHVVVEHDDEWMDTFDANFKLPVSTRVQRLEVTAIEVDDDTPPVLRYAEFKQTLGGAKYDFIIIDGPYGDRAAKYSRVDIIDLIPDSLADQFVIMLDDYNRAGEQHTATKIAEALDAAGIEYATATYTGEKVFWIVTSIGLRFYTSL